MDDKFKIVLLTNMLRVRHLEELCSELYSIEKIRGFLHLYIGEEAVVAGVMSQINSKDQVMATYREHGHALLKGISAKSILAEMFGKQSGCSGGWGGSMHLFSKENNFFGGNAIVAAGIPQAVGLALASKRLNNHKKTLCFFGEGAMAEGVFYEAINMASLWDIPLLFCCENNLYAMGTALKRSQAQTNLLEKIRVHKIECDSADGMNVMDVVEKAKKAFEYIENKKRPYFLECKTYRFRPHSMFDPDLYRSNEEILEWKKKDPIESFKHHLFESGILNVVMFNEILKLIDAEMKEASDFADQAKIPQLSEMESSTYGYNL